MSIDELKFVRVIDTLTISRIPRYLFEQIEGVDVDTFLLCLPQAVADPLEYVIVLTDAKEEIHGFMWAQVNAIEGSIFIYASTLDVKYQSDSQLFDAGIKYLLGMPIDGKYKHKITAITTRPRAFERHGWVRSKQVVMEYTVKESRDVLEDTRNKVEAA